MKAKSQNIKIFIVITFIFLLISAYYPVYGQQGNKEFYMAIELNNVLCGYSRILLSDSLINGKKVEVLRYK